MKPYYDNGVVQLYQADAREIPLPDRSVHCVVTSPPQLFQQPTAAPSGTTSRATCDCEDEVMEGESRTLTVRPYSPIPAIVLDPFAGTATTCFAAQKLGRRAVGVDISEAYLKQAVKRLSAVPLPLIKAAK